MTRRWNYDAVRAEAIARQATVRTFAGMDTVRDQPHDDEHWLAQYRADRARMINWYATGKLVATGPRRFRLG